MRDSGVYEGCIDCFIFTRWVVLDRSLPEVSPESVLDRGRS